MMNHPEIRSGRKSESEVKSDLNEAVYTFNGIFGDKLSIDQLMLFFSLYGMQLDEDKYFGIVVTSSWSIKSATTSKELTDDY